MTAEARIGENNLPLIQFYVDQILCVIYAVFQQIQSGQQVVCLIQAQAAFSAAVKEQAKCSKPTRSMSKRKRYITHLHVEALHDIFSLLYAVWIHGKAGDTVVKHGLVPGRLSWAVERLPGVIRTHVSCTACNCWGQMLL